MRQGLLQLKQPSPGQRLLLLQPSSVKKTRSGLSSSLRCRLTECYLILTRRQSRSFCFLHGAKPHRDSYSVEHKGYHQYRRQGLVLTRVNGLAVKQ